MADEYARVWIPGILTDIQLHIRSEGLGISKLIISDKKDDDYKIAASVMRAIVGAAWVDGSDEAADQVMENLQMGKTYPGARAWLEKDSWNSWKDWPRTT